MSLSKKDIRVLSRLQVSTEERILIENRWSATPEKNGVGFLLNVGLELVVPSLVAIFIGSQFYTKLTPIANIATVITWALYSLLDIGQIAIALMIAGFGHTKKEEILDRLAIRFLPGGVSPFRQVYSKIQWLGMFASTAAIGLSITAFFILMSWVLTLLTNYISRKVVQQSLREMVEQAKTNGARISRVIST